MNKSRIYIIVGIIIVTLSVGFYFGLFSPKKVGIANENSSEFIQINALSKVIQEKDKERKKEEAPRKEIKRVYKPIALDKESCDSLKGKWVQRPLDEKYVCNIPTSDSGKDCIDGAECEGSCLAEVKKSESGIIELVKGGCSDWTIVLGCLDIMEEGSMVTICRD